MLLLLFGPRCELFQSMFQWWLILVRAFRQLLERVVEGKTTRFLARREFLERGEELSDALLRWHQDEGVIDPPPAVINALVVGRLEGIRAQVEQFRETQRHEGILPYIQPDRPLFGKDALVLLIPQPYERPVVAA